LHEEYQEVVFFLLTVVWDGFIIFLCFRAAAGADSPIASAEQIVLDESEEEENPPKRESKSPEVHTAAVRVKRKPTRLSAPVKFDSADDDDNDHLEEPEKELQPAPVVDVIDPTTLDAESQRVLEMMNGPGLTFSFTKDQLPYECQSNERLFASIKFELGRAYLFERVRRDHGVVKYRRRLSSSIGIDKITTICPGIRVDYDGELILSVEGWYQARLLLF
jgi:hypothetical protein